MNKTWRRLHCLKCNPGRVSLTQPETRPSWRQFGVKPLNSPVDSQTIRREKLRVNSVHAHYLVHLFIVCIPKYNCCGYSKGCMGGYPPVSQYGKLNFFARGGRPKRPPFSRCLVTHYAGSHRLLSLRWEAISAQGVFKKFRQYDPSTFFCENNSTLDNSFSNKKKISKQ